MNVNGINDPEMIKQRAQQLLTNNEKVNLGKEDLETLWESVKLVDPSVVELGISDEQAIAQFDALDNENNTAMTSYKLFFNWLKNGAKLDAPSSGDNSTQPPTDTDTPETDTNPPETETNPPETDTNTPETDITPPETETNPPETDTTPPETETTPDSDVTTPPATNTQKSYIQFFGGDVQEIEIDGKKYNITNDSSTINNIAYYVKDGVVMFEGSDFKINSIETDGAVNDNVKIMGNRNTVDFGDGDDLVEAEGAMNSIFGGIGDDFVKIRGDYNTTNLQGGNDVAWMAGNTNVAIGAGGDDNFFAIGQGNTLYGQDDTDAKYYNETEGVGHDYRVENIITDGTDFEKWVKGEEPDDGPPYANPPTALDGHEVRAYDDNTYTDKYEVSPNYITEYRDIAYRDLQAETTVDRVDVGNATVTKFADGAESETITITPETVTVKNADGEAVIPSEIVVYKDSAGNVITNTGTIDDLVEKLATGKYTIDTAGYVNNAESGDISTDSDVSAGVTDTDNNAGDNQSTSVNNNVLTQSPSVSDKVDTNTNTDVNTTTNTTTSAPVTNVNTSTAQKVYVQLFDNESTTLDFDGKQYTFTNTSSTVNNFAYYMQNGVVTIEGSDLSMESINKDTDIDDNIKLLGNRNTINTSVGNDTIEVEGAMNNVFAGKGEDFAKAKGDYNTINTQAGNDTIWMNGNFNTALGSLGDDNIFSNGDGNTLYGQDDTDGKFYLNGVSHDYRVENVITDGADFENWVNGKEPTDGPPYSNPPAAEDGHEVRAYDDNTYTDKYEVTPNYITEYRDIAYREMQAETTVDRVNVGNATVTKYEDGDVSQTISITPEAITVVIGDETITIPASEIVYEDSSGNPITNTGTIDNLVEMLATGKFKISLSLLEEIQARLKGNGEE